MFDRVEIGNCSRKKGCPFSGRLAALAKERDFASTVAFLENRLETVTLTPDRHLKKTVDRLSLNVGSTC